jgi:hypothetical protein
MGVSVIVTVAVPMVVVVRREVNVAASQMPCWFRSMRMGYGR